MPAHPILPTVGVMRSTLPKAVRDLTQEFLRLPGVGPKTAQRLAIHLLRQPSSVVIKFADAMRNLHANVRICSTCFNLSEAEVCGVCKEATRDTSVVCVVEDPLDVEAIERTDSYSGLYHVLGGTLSPMEGVGVDQLTIKELFERIEQGSISELILALDQNMEGEATSRYIMDRLPNDSIRVTRLARGLPTGGDIEFADAMTLHAAFEGRKQLK